MENPTKETLVVQIENWAAVIDRCEFQKMPDRMVMRSFLESCGFDFSKLKGNEDSMKSWTSMGSKDAMKAVMGDEKKQAVEKWMEDFIEQDEEKTGIKQMSVPLQNNPDKSTKISGLKGALHLITRWASFDQKDDLDLDSKRMDTELWVRMKNGFYLKEGKKEMRMKITRPDTKEMYRPGSFPPGYIGALINYLDKRS